MTIKNYCFLAKKSFFGKKINILNVFLLVISMLIIIFALSFFKTSKNLIDNQINGNINNHILMIRGVVNNELNQIDNIKYIVDYNSFSHSVKTETGNVINLIGIPNDYLNVFIGKNLNEVNDDNVLICPLEFYLGDSPEKYDKSFLSKLSDGKKLLDETLTLKSLNYEKKYEIIGLYDNNKYSYGEYNTCFTKQNNILEIYTNEIINYKNECKKENRDCDNLESSDISIVVIDDVNSIDKTKDKIEKLGFLVRKLGEVDMQGINFIMTLLFTISLIIMIVTFIIILVSNNKFIQYNKKNNLLYMSLGYDNNILIKINYLEAFFLSIFSFMLSIVISLILYFVLCNVLVADIKTGCPICVSNLSILLSLIFPLVISLLSVYLSLKNNNNSIIGEFSDAEI